MTLKLGCRLVEERKHIPNVESSYCKTTITETCANVHEEQAANLSSVNAE